jgi:hypothetical protein
MVVSMRLLGLSFAWIRVLAVFIEVDIFVDEFLKRPIGLEGAVVHFGVFLIGLNFLCFKCLENSKLLKAAQNQAG